MGKLKETKVLGLPLYIYLILTAVVFVISVRGNLLDNMIGALACSLLVGTALGIVGDKIPIWNQWLGGGILFANLAASAIATFGIFPETTIKTLSTFNNGTGFLELYVLVLIVGSVLSVNRKMLIKSFVGYIPVILAGIVGAFLLAAGAALLMGKSPIDSILSIALPIMGGGNGAGALPMSKIYGEVTGIDPAGWYAASFATLMLGNIVAVLAAAILNKLGEKYPNLSGGGQLMKVEITEKSVSPVADIKVGFSECAAALALGVFCYVFADFYAAHLSITNNVLNLSFDIHKFAFMVIIAAALNVLNLIPADVLAGAKAIQTFFVKYMSFPLLFMVGLGTNLNDYVKVFSLSNMVIIVAVVVGACIGSGLMGHLFHFYPIEAMITAGLCMANAGGSGDVQVLGTAKRMELMPYAQISSRIGGAIMLVIASFMFSSFLG